MITFHARRWFNTAVLAALALAILLVYLAGEVSLRNMHFLTGWILLAAMVLLASYNIRKKFPFLPLLRSSWWLQVHIYVGWLTVILFLCHLRFAWPTGWLEGTLALCYAIVALSGIVGLIYSRVFAKRLTTHTAQNEGVLYERISVYRRRLREEAEALAIRSITEGEATTIADFYSTRLASFFDAPRGFWSHLAGSNRPLDALMRDMRSLQRYLKDAERKVLDEIAEIVRAKDSLDYQWAVMSVMKWWLFVHIPLTYALMIISFVHVVLVYAFAGGAA